MSIWTDNAVKELLERVAKLETALAYIDELRTKLETGSIDFKREVEAQRNVPRGTENLTGRRVNGTRN